MAYTGGLKLKPFWTRGPFLIVVFIWALHFVWVFISPVSLRSQAFDTWLSRPLLQWVNARHQKEVARAEGTRLLGDVLVENQQLKEQIQALQNQQRQWDQDRESLGGLTQMLDLQKSTSAEATVAEVIYHTRPRFFGTLVINKGVSEGLKIDQPVITAQGVIGRVWSVGSHQSTILPVDAPNIGMAVYLSTSKSSGILQGRSENLGEILYLRSETSVQTGESIFTSGLDNIYPRGLLVGHVKEVRSEGGASRILVQLAPRLDQLRYVLILPHPTPLESLSEPVVQ